MNIGALHHAIVLRLNLEVAYKVLIARRFAHIRPERVKRDFNEDVNQVAGNGGFAVGACADCWLRRWWRKDPLLQRLCLRSSSINRPQCLSRRSSRADNQRVGFGPFQVFCRIQPCFR